MAQSKYFQVGDTFLSYKGFQEHLEEFEWVNFVKLIHRDLSLLIAAAKRAPKVMKKINKELLYYSIVLFNCLYCVTR